MQKFEKAILVATTVIALAMICYHMVYTQLVLLEPTQHQNLHLMCALSLVFLNSFRRSKNAFLKYSALASVLLSLYATGYVFEEYTDLIEERGPICMMNDHDLVVGTIILLLSLEASRRAFGLAFPIVAVLFMCYGYFGHILPSNIAAPEMSYAEMITALVMGLSGGIYGNTMGVSANYIFLFVVFGALLSATGASNFFNRVGALAGKKLAGGPAISAVISSALMGSITGSALANVATTGTFTIPLMKKAGYQPHQAGAIEAAASTGGQIMPPVMGATAFVLAEMANVPYVEVMTAAIIPALLYFLSVGIYAQLQAKKLKISAANIMGGDVSAIQLLSEAPLFIGPLVVIMTLLWMGFSPMFTVFWAILCLLGINLIYVCRSGKLRGMLPDLIDEMRAGAITGSNIAVTCAVLGPVVAIMTKTSLGIRIPSIIEMLCNGNVVFALVLTAFVCILLGMGVPTLAAYLMVAMVGVPALVHLGVPTFSAHMYVFVFAVFSCITPPVATAAIPASGIAGSSYMRTAFEAAKIGCVGFIIPFFCVFAPEIMIGQSSSGIMANVIATIWVFFAILLICMGFCGYFLRTMPTPSRIAAAATGVLMTTCMFFREVILIIPTASACFSILGWEILASRRGRA